MLYTNTHAFIYLNDFLWHILKFIGSWAWRPIPLNSAEESRWLPCGERGQHFELVYISLEQLHNVHLAGATIVGTLGVMRF